jgi:hypothetical protein
MSRYALAAIKTKSSMSIKTDFLSPELELLDMAIMPATAEKRRELYLIRHADNAIKVGTPGYYAAKILWS